MSKTHNELIKQFILDKKKIQGIKTIRKITFISLKEAKELYEKFEADLSFLDNFSFIDKNGAPYKGKQTFKYSDIVDEAIALLETNKKLKAVICLRKYLKISIKEAGSVIEKYIKTGSMNLNKFHQKEPHSAPDDDLKPTDSKE